MSELDVIVVGAGTAGLPCAMTAAVGGARVAVIEKADRVGGTLHVNGGQFSGAATRRQRAHGIDDSPDEHFAEVMRISHGHADADLVRIAVDEAPSTVDWLDELGFPFLPEMPAYWYGHEPYSTPRTYWGANAGKDVFATLAPAWERAVAEHGIEVLLEHRLTDLLVEGGSVTGVRVEGPHGARELRAPAVVLATGGYAANPELYAETLPGLPPLVSGAPWHSTGDGILAARRAGAGFRGAERQLTSLSGIEQEPGRVDVLALSPAHTPQYRQPRELQVNARGERFVAEDDPSVDRRERALMAQGDDRYWRVFDEPAIAGEPLVPAWGEDGLRAAAERGEVCFRASDLRKLAHLAGIDPEGLARTVAAWNEAVRAGSDPLGRRVVGPALGTPPFYALACTGVTFLTFGGLPIDTAFRVLDEDGEPIPGLYAIGESIGAAATMGDAFCGGMCVTPAISFGRILGRRLAGVEAAV